MKLNIENILPHPLQTKITAVQSEDDAYAADELVELGEEILSQLAAMGIAAYLKQPKQKEVFNDFLISLLLSDGHSYNAGPLYRWAANMLTEAEGADTSFGIYKENIELLQNQFTHAEIIGGSNGLFVGESKYRIYLNCTKQKYC